MTGSTHKMGGAFAGLLTIFCVVVLGITIPRYNINIVVQLLLLYQCVIWGSTFPDIDINVADYDYTNKLINRVFKIVFSEDKDLYKHRSVVTHSMYTVIFFVIVLFVLGVNLKRNPADVTTELIFNMVLGAFIGVLSHFVLDMRNPQGIYIFKKKFSLFKLRYWFKFKRLQKLQRANRESSFNLITKLQLHMSKEGVQKATEDFATGGIKEKRLAFRLSWYNSILAGIIILFLINTQVNIVDINKYLPKAINMTEILSQMKGSVSLK